MEILTVLKDTPIPTLLVAGGLVFLILAIVSQAGGKFKVASKRQNISIVIGIVLLLFGVVLYLIPTMKPDSQKNNIPTITGVAMREDIENGELVIRQEINFFDKDGNTNYVEWELVNLSDPSQRQYIQIKNGEVNALLEEQINGTYTIGAWNCRGHVYVATLDVYLLDKSGGRSEPYRYTIECK